MNDRQENKLSMYLMLLEVVSKHKSVWENIPKVVEVVERLQEKVRLIQETHSDIIRTISKGHTKDKAKIKEELVTSLDLFISVLRVIAKGETDSTLSEQIKHTRTGLLRLRDTELSGIAKSIQEAVNEHDQVLRNGFKIPSEQFDLLAQNIAVYDEIFAKPIMTRNERIQANQSLSAQITNAFQFIKEDIDNTMNIFKVINPTFYTSYQFARRVPKV